MAVVATTTTDETPTVKRWVMPRDPEAIRSPVPTGVIIYNGATPIAAKIDVNTSVFTLNCTLPNSFAYILKTCLVSMISDDVLNDWNALGVGSYTVDPLSNLVIFSLEAQGNSLTAAGTRAVKVFAPERQTPKLILRRGSDLFNLVFTDASTDVSAAGDAFYHVEFYQYEIAQISNYEINTPLPTISHTSF